MILGELTDGWVYSDTGHDHDHMHQNRRITRLMTRILKTFGVVVEGFPTLHHLRLAYLHVQLLADRYLELNMSHTNRVVNAAFEIVSLLQRKDAESVSPLTHHWAALTAMTLVECMERMGNRESIMALHDLQERISTGQLRSLESGQIEATAWDNAISTYITKKLEQRSAQGPDHDNGRGGLEHLADAAVSKSKSVQDGQAGDEAANPQAASVGVVIGDATEPYDWEEGIVGGYLIALQEKLRR